MADAKACFVIMPFGQPFDRYYLNIFVPAITAVGLKPLRADSIFSPSTIMADVWQFTRQAVVVLADVTGKHIVETRLTGMFVTGLPLTNAYADLQGWAQLLDTYLVAQRAEALKTERAFRAELARLKLTGDWHCRESDVTEGVVAKLPTKTDRRDQNNNGMTMIGSTGDTYQLDIFAGPGHSGGPVIDSTGKVIAIMSMRRVSAEHVSFAVPVSYVRELLQPQRNASP